MAKVIHQCPGSMEDLLLTLKHRYLPKQPTKTLHSYLRQPNTGLDEDIQLYEFTTAIQKLRKHTAPGADQISNKILANLNEVSLSLDGLSKLELAYHLSNIWKSGTIPQECKTTEVRFIQKPGKPHTIKNLRPISLTSCVGKLLEQNVSTTPPKYS
ncbi:hypothetical protein HPB49_017496 [Dermacentor silvarum]|uniref:Uncharacterized protein n=1 Tax=Dermacentor silvarum TaxID=543639 RepID=A0ACB8DJV0_DERSI|nr:hypothetical protein HPB49_017496 [Dermacentor silvarum]